MSAPKQVLHPKKQSMHCPQVDEEEEMLSAWVMAVLRNCMLKQPVQSAFVEDTHPAHDE